MQSVALDRSTSNNPTPLSFCHCLTLLTAQVLQLLGFNTRCFQHHGFKLYTIFLGPTKTPWIATVQHSTVRRVTFVTSPPPGRPGCLHKDVLRKSGSSFSSCAASLAKSHRFFNGKIHLPMVNVPLKCQLTLQYS